MQIAPWHPRTANGMLFERLSIDPIPDAAPAVVVLEEPDQFELGDGLVRPRKGNRRASEKVPDQVPQATISVERAEDVREVPVFGLKQLFDGVRDGRFGKLGRVSPQCLSEKLGPVRVACRPIVQRCERFSAGQASRASPNTSATSCSVSAADRSPRYRLSATFFSGEAASFRQVQHVGGAGEDEHVSREFRLDVPGRKDRANRTRELESGVGQKGADFIEEEHDANVVGGTRGLLQERQKVALVFEHGPLEPPIRPASWSIISPAI